MRNAFNALIYLGFDPASFFFLSKVQILPRNYTIYHVSIHLKMSEAGSLNQKNLMWAFMQCFTALVWSLVCTHGAGYIHNRSGGLKCDTEPCIMWRSENCQDHPRLWMWSASQPHCTNTYEHGLEYGKTHKTEITALLLIVVSIIKWALMFNKHAHS